MNPAGIQPVAAQPLLLYLKLLTKTFISLAFGVKRELLIGILSGVAKAGATE